MYNLNYCCICKTVHTYKEKPKDLSKEHKSQSKGVLNRQNWKNLSSKINMVRIEF